MLLEQFVLPLSMLVLLVLALFWATPGLAILRAYFDDRDEEVDDER